MSLSTNLLAYYAYQGNSNDSVGSNNGTDTSVSYSNSYGIIGNGASFNGSTSFISTSSPVVNSGTTFSFSTWIYSTNFSQQTDSTILSNQKDTGNYGFIFGNHNNSSNSWQVFYGNGSGAWQGYGANDFTLTNSAWNHIVATINGNVLTVYKNATQIFQATYANNMNFSSANNLYIGRDPDPTHQGVRNFTGYIDETGIWNKVLSSTEVTQLYNGGAGLAYPFTINNANFMAFM